MRGVRQTIQAARRRLIAAQAITHAGTGLAWGAGAGLMAVVIERLVGRGIDWWWLAGIPVAVGGAIGIARAIMTRPSELIAAGEVDDAMSLRDRLTTGLSLKPGQDAGFTALAMREADSAATRVDPRRAVKFQFGGSWYTFPLLACAAAGVAFFAPHLDLLGREREARRAADEQFRRTQVAADVAEAVEALSPGEPEALRGEAKSTQLAELDRLREELDAGRLNADDATAKAVNELQSLAEQSERASELAAMKSRAISESLSTLNRSANGGGSGRDGGSGESSAAAPGSGNPDGQDVSGTVQDDPAQESPLTRAVRSGDLGAAREAARELMRRQSLSAEERRELAADLDRLAADLNELEAQEARERQQADIEVARRQEPSVPPGDDAAESEPPASRGGDVANQAPGHDPSKNPAPTPAEPQSNGNESRPPGDPAAPKGNEAKRDPAGNAERNQGSKNASERAPDPQGQPSPAGDEPPQAPPSTSEPQEPRSQGEPNRGGEKQNGRAASESAAPQPDGSREKQTRQPAAGEAQPNSPESSKGGDAPREGSRRETGGTGAQRKPAAPDAVPNSVNDVNREKEGEGTEISEKELRERLERSGMTPEDAQRAAEKMSTEAREREASQQAAEERRELASRLKNAAKALSEGEAQRQNDGKEQPPSSTTSDKGETRKNDASNTPGPPAPGSEKPESAQPQGAQGNGSDEKEPGERSPAPERGENASPAGSGKSDKSKTSPDPAKAEPASEPSTSPSDKPGREEALKPAGSPHGAPKPEGEAPPRGESPVPPGSAQPPSGAPQSLPRAGEKGPPPSTGPGTRPQQPEPKGGTPMDVPVSSDTNATPGPPQTGGPKPDTSPDGGGPDESDLPEEIPEPTKEAIDRLADQLDRMDTSGAKDRETGARAREQAQKLAEKLSPQQQERLRKWAEGLARQRPEVAEKFAGGEPGGRQDGDGAPGPVQPDGSTAGSAAGEGATPEGRKSPQPYGPSRTEIVDARGVAVPRGNSQNQVVAEWLAPPTPGTVHGPAAADRMRQAAKSAQQAVDDRAIPARYDRLVQRYFRRLPDKVAERAAPPPETIPARDAP